MYDFHVRCSENRRYNDEILMAHQLIPEYWCYLFANGVTILTVHPSIPLTQIVIVYNLPKVNGACISCHLKLMIVLTNRKTILPTPIRSNPGSQSIYPSSASYIVFRGFILELMMYLTLKSPSCNTTVDITRTETSTVFRNNLN